LLDDVKHLPSLPNLYIAAGGGALALAVHPADSSVNGALQSHAQFANAFWKPGHIVGSGYVEAGAALVTYAYGELFHAPKAAHFGMDMLRAEIIAQGLTDVLKYTVRRERPDHSDSYSFPSGHAAGAFALATIIERHMRWQMAGVGYAFAAYVAASRLHDNVHYLSDVVFGAAIGTISGRTVTLHGRNNWTFVPIPTDGGMAVMVMRSAP
jgi:membrane-associated phospholipid phosphatase